MTNDKGHSASPPELPNWLCLSVLAAFTLVTFAKVLFIHPGEVLSDRRWDLAHYFVHWRYFGFQELKSGNLALWNPHCYSGVPFFGNFQSGLLYPLNFLYLLLPLEPAVNWTIALHVFLAGVFMFYWVRQRGMHSLACLLSALMAMFCGPHFLQIQVGHLPNLCTLIWAPLLFLAIDQLADGPALRPCLLGMFAVGMSILAGHPQYVFYIGVAAALYSILNLIKAKRRGAVMAGLAVIAAGGFCLAAVQLLTGLQEGRESIRSIGVSHHFASTYSFPPENILTLLAPWFLGDVKTVPYFGRWYLTEVSLFVSVAGLVLAVYGMATGAPAARRFSIIMLIAMLALALGGYTPWFELLFNYVPGFNLFRGMDKFLWLTALFLSMLAGIGLDQMLKGGPIPKWLAAGAVAAGFILGAASFLPRELEWWAGTLHDLMRTDEARLPDSAYADPNFIAQTAAQCSLSLFTGAACLLLVASLLFLARSRRPIACGGILLMTAVELVCFAQTSLMSFQLLPAYVPRVVAFLLKNPGDYRVQYVNPNCAMTEGTLDIGGDDPSALLRYMRYLAFIRGLDSDTVQSEMPPLIPNGWGARILRCRYAFMLGRAENWTAQNPLPRLLLADQFRIMTNYHEIFSTLTNLNFHAEEEVILESPPEPLPQPAAEKGTVKLIDSSTDSATIEADTKTPCLLLMTDAYSQGWRALSLPGSSQPSYQIMPADYCLRAIPLAAGHHLLRMEYSPLGFRVGKVISMAAWPVFIALTILAFQRSKLPVQSHAQD